jgi:four helix bundle protein
VFNFEMLDVWQESVAFAQLVYRLTRTFPSDERFGITNQMRRAAVSVSSNLAEGCSRSSKVDYARFVEIAAGSVFEVVSQAHLTKSEGYLSDCDFAKLYCAAEKLSRMLSGLRRSLRSAGSAAD